jgi:hypothetical protein
MQFDGDFVALNDILNARVDNITMAKAGTNCYASAIALDRKTCLITLIQAKKRCVTFHERTLLDYFT